MRYTPFETMERMFEQMVREMADWRETGLENRFGPGYGLNTDLAEHDDEYVLTIDLPGFETDEIELRFDDGFVHLSASHDVTDERSHRSRSVSERVHVPREVVADEIAATYRNGVLELHLPIVEDGAEHGRRIEIE